MAYIADYIGDEYLTWKPKDTVVISSQTGSGKSTFVLRKLLKNAIDNNKHLVYICNRRVLKEQIDVLSKEAISAFFQIEMTDLSDIEMKYIHVLTYQFCEVTNQIPNLKIFPKLPCDIDSLRKAKSSNASTKAFEVSSSDIMYYVFDEAHYFIYDAQFNNKTNYWNTVIPAIKSGVSVFLTATPEPLFLYLTTITNSINNAGIYGMIEDAIIRKEARNKTKSEMIVESTINIKLKTGKKEAPHPAIVYKHTEDEIAEIFKSARPYQKAFDFISRAQYALNNKASQAQFCSHFYNLPSVFDRINPYYFTEYNDLIYSILSSQEKWLVFVDSKKDGIDLCSQLTAKGKNAVYVSSGTSKRSSPNGYTELRNIVECGKFECDSRGRVAR